MNKTAIINVQDVFLNQARKEGVPLTIHVTNGFQIKNAVVKGYDSFVVLVEAEGKQMMIYKHAISTVTPEHPINIRGNGSGIKEEHNAD